jgi:hypothetical protein
METTRDKSGNVLAPAIEAFVARWQGRDGGQERANYAMFLRELCDALGLQPPDPAGDPETNDYVFERVVKEPGRDGAVSSRRIDLYKRGSFVLEAKQSRQQKGGDKEDTETPMRGRRGADRAWDVLMLNARRQAEDYVRLLPSGHEPPAFVIVCDVGHCFEVYANFRRDGKAFDQFPDRQSFRVYLEDLRLPAVRERLAAIWNDPLSLDPAKRTARVTRAIASRLAAVSKALEDQGHRVDEVAMFVMRCLFTMFAEDVGLLPEKSFKEVLERCEQDPTTFQPDVGQLWQAMDEGGYAYAIRKKVPRFNGEFFKERPTARLAKGRAPARGVLPAGLRIVIASRPRSSMMVALGSLPAPQRRPAGPARPSGAPCSILPLARVDDPLDQASFKSACRAEAKECRRWK